MFHQNSTQKPNELAGDLRIYGYLGVLSGIAIAVVSTMTNLLLFAVFALGYPVLSVYLAKLRAGKA